MITDDCGSRSATIGTTVFQVNRFSRESFEGHRFHDYRRETGKRLDVAKVCGAKRCAKHVAMRYASVRTFPSRAYQQRRFPCDQHIVALEPNMKLCAKMKRKEYVTDSRRPTRLRQDSYTFDGSTRYNSSSNPHEPIYSGTECLR